MTQYNSYDSQSDIKFSISTSYDNMKLQDEKGSSLHEINFFGNIYRIIYLERSF